jgi:hypothetical protein
MTNFETKPRQRVESVAAKVKSGSPKASEESAQAQRPEVVGEEEMPPVQLTRSHTSIIKDIGGPEDQKKLLGLVLLLVAAFLLKKYFDL